MSKWPSVLKCLSLRLAVKLSHIEKKCYSRLQLTLPITLEGLANHANLTHADLEQLATNLQIGSSTLTSEETTRLLSSLHFDADVLIDINFGKTIYVPLSVYKRPLGESSGDKHIWPLRPPVVTILGHVDHGKTTLLDALRKTNVAAGEAGGITQHIGAFSGVKCYLYFLVSVPDFPGTSITFLDTPGHAAFTEMRRRGANVTDIAVIVIAADDGIMPQTIECINIAKESQVPIIVAITKSDLMIGGSFHSLTIMRNLTRYDIHVEPLGGPIQIVTLSAKTGKGLADLLAAIAALGEQLDLRAPGLEEGPSALDAYVLEAKTIQGLGPTTTLLLRAGSLSLGSLIASHDALCKVRKISGNAKVALPSQVVEVSGWRSLPTVGSRVRYLGHSEKSDFFDDIRDALQKLAAYDADIMEQRISPDSLCLKILLFCDVSGSIEPISRVINDLGKNPKVKARIIRASLGHPTQWDIDYAKIAEAIIVLFNVPENPKICEYASSLKQKIHTFSIVYDLVDKLKILMGDMLPPITIETKLSTARVKRVFSISFNKSKGGDALIAGCIIEDGIMKNNSSTQIRIRRMGELVYSGKIKELRVHKDLVASVSRGKECGIHFEPRFTNLQVGDEIHLVSLHTEKDKIHFEVP